MSDCVFTAWADYVKYLGGRVNWLDRVGFWHWRLQLDQTKPGQPTKIEYLPELITLLSYPKRIAIERIDLDIYMVDDFPGQLIQAMLCSDQHGVRYGIQLTEGIFCSLNSKHAYFTPSYRGGDWVCMAIKLRRF